MTNIASFNVRIGARVSDFQKKMGAVQRRMTDVGQQMQSIGKSLTMKLTAPLLGLAGVSAKVFDTQIQAEQQLAAALAATGQEVDRNLIRFQEFAKNLQAVTTVGDESTLKLLQVGTNMGLNADQAERAAQNAIALSKAMGINEQSAIRYTAALEQGNSTMLARYLPTIRSIEDESQRTAKAQELLAQMFENARTEAQVGLGPYRQLKNTLGDILEEFGKVIVDALKPFAAGLKNIFAGLQQTSPATKRMIVLIGALTAAIGPLIVALGTLSVALGAISLPMVGLVALVAGLAAGFTLLAGNAKAIANTLAGVFLKSINFVSDLLSKFLGAIENLAKKVGVHLLDGMAEKFKEIFTVAVPDSLNASEQEWKGFGAIFSDVANRIFGTMDQLQIKTRQTATTTTEALGSIPDAFQGGVTGEAGLGMMRTQLQQIATVDVPMVSESFTQLSLKQQEFAQGLQGITSQIQSTLAGAFVEMADSGMKAADQIKQAFVSMIRTIAAQLAAKAALFGLFNLILPGSTGVLTGGRGALSFITGGLAGNTGASLNVGQATRIRGEDIYQVNQIQRDKSNRTY